MSGTAPCSQERPLAQSTVIITQPVLAQTLADAGYVWQADAVLDLRRRYGIIGTMVGGLPGQKQQNDHHGLPMQLTRAELSHLLHRGLILQCACNLSHTRCDVSKTLDTGVEHSASYSDDASIDEEWRPRKRHRRNPAHEPDSGVLLRVEDCPAYWLDPTTKAKHVALSQDATQPTRAATMHERVFDDLHARGYTLTDGIKFGGHFLAYLGDPLTVHAAFVVRVLRKDCTLPDVSLSAANRAAIGAKKRLLLAFVDVDSDDADVEYITAILTEGAEDHPAKG